MPGIYLAGFEGVQEDEAAYPERRPGEQDYIYGEIGVIQGGEG